MNKPEITFYPNGQKKTEDHFIIDNGQLVHSRLDGPASQRWYKNGQKKRENYYVNGILHRDAGPALTIWYPNGVINYTQYVCNRILHRCDGPQFQCFDESGKLNYNQYYIMGKELFPKDLDEFKKMVKLRMFM